MKGKKTTTNNGPPAQDIKRMFSRISRRYDFLNSAMTFGMHHRWKRLAARIAVGKDLGPALDVATGTGDLAFELAKLPGVTSVVGIDFCADMLEVAKLKHGYQKTKPQTSFTLGDALALDYQDNVFQFVVSGFALRNVENIETAISEMARVVKPGGRICVLELTPLTGRAFWEPFLKLYLKTVLPVLGQLLAKDRSAYTYLPNSVDRFPNAEELASLFKGCGLVKVGFKRMNLGTIAIHWGTKP